VAACARPPSPTPAPATAIAPPIAPPIATPIPTSTPTSTSTSTATATSIAHPAFAHLEVPGYLDAVVSFPRVPGKRPVMVAVHGLRGRADWSCRIARHVMQARAFVLCPEGKPAHAVASDGDYARFTFASPAALAKEIDAGLDALARAYPDEVDTSRLLYYGHSLGASFAVAMLRDAPARWSRVVMSEGGYGGWWPSAKAHAAGQRVLFACGTPECLNGATASVRALAKAARDPVPAKVVYAEGAGHHSYGPIVDVMEAEHAWLVEGDERFAP